MSNYTYRLRAPKGLDDTLIKELKLIMGLKESQVRKVPGRKAIELQGDQQVLWHLLSRSRIVEDVQIRLCKPFTARGEKEFEKNLQKVPWHAYMPNGANHKEFEMPQATAKSFGSKLYHTHLIRNLLMHHMSELPIVRAFKRLPDNQQVNFNQFKKQWLQQNDKGRPPTDKVKAVQKKNQVVVAQEDEQFQKLDQVRTKLQDQAKEKRALKRLSKVMVNIHKDNAEVLLSTSYESLHKHGYRPYVRWGVLNETLAAACILESGILERARRSGKLYLWDPFCGSGSFLIETLMSALEQPVRGLDQEFPFQHWPIFEREKFEHFRNELEEFKKIKHDIDVQIIGSDVSQRAVQTASSNMEFAKISAFNGVITPHEHNIINSPLTYGEHWPKSTDQGGLINFKEQRRNIFLSLYQGDFQQIGQQLYQRTSGFKDFTILTNPPYGYQSAENQRMGVKDTQNLYRRLGRFLGDITTVQDDSHKEVQGAESDATELQTHAVANTGLKQVYVVAKSQHYGHELSFEKYSNCGWNNILHFSNSGLSVNLLRLSAKKVSRSKETLRAYGAIPEARRTGRKQLTLE